MRRNGYDIVRLTNDHRCATMTTDDHGRDASPLGNRDF
jgi:hypothetical protein